VSNALVKTVDQELTEEMLRGLVGHYVHAPTNELELVHPVEQTAEVHNVWFAGLCVGFQKTEMHFDYVNDEFMDEPEVTYMLMLSEGTAYMLSRDKLELRTLTEEEFIEMVAASNANQAIEEESKEPSNIILFEEKKKLLVPGRDF
jgi:hypothetical protein